MFRSSCIFLGLEYILGSSCTYIRSPMLLTSNACRMESKTHQKILNCDDGLAISPRLSLSLHAAEQKIMYFQSKQTFYRHRGGVFSGTYPCSHL